MHKTTNIMNLDDFLNPQNRIVDIESDSLPIMYGLDEDDIIDKVKRVMEVALSDGVEKDHEVIESVFALGETEIERVLLAHLLGKYFVTKQYEGMEEMMKSLALGMTMAVATIQKTLDLDDESRDVIQTILISVIESAMEE